MGSVKEFGINKLEEMKALHRCPKCSCEWVFKVKFGQEIVMYCRMCWVAHDSEDVQLL